MQLEQEARKKIAKILKTIEFLSSRLAGETNEELNPHKRQYIQDDIDSLEFLLEYAREALAQRGIRV